MRYRRAAKYIAHMKRYLTIGKIRNYVRFRNDLRNKKIVTSSFPPQIYIQASAYCNSNCQLCPVGLKIEGPSKGFLEFDIYKRIIDDIKKYIIRVDFGDWGEPFLNPELFKMIEYAEKNKVMTAASSNMHWFNSDDDLKRIIDCGLSFLTISLHGASCETYEVYQPGKDFNKTIEKITKLVSFKNMAHSKVPILDLVFAITKKNQHEMAKMHTFAVKLGADSITYPASLNVRFYLNDSGKLTNLVKEWALEGSRLPRDTTAFGKDSAIRLYNAICKENLTSFQELDRNKLTGRHFCLDPWRQLVINWDGTISLCCADYYKHVIGDTQTESIVEIWNNDNYRAVRKYLLDGEHNNLNLPCERCIIY